MDIYSLALSMYITRKTYIVTASQEWSYVHIQDIHQHIVGFIIYIIEALEICRAAHKVSFSGQVHPHGFQIQPCIFQMRFCAKGV